MSRPVALMISLALFAAATALALCLAYCRAEDEDRDSEKESETVPRQDGTVNTGSFTYQTELSDAVKTALNTTDAAYLILANKSTLIGEDYVPGRLAALDSRYVVNQERVYELEENAALAVTAMLDEMRECGFENIYVTSAYRSYAYQQWLFDYYMGQERAADPSLSEEQIKEKVLSYSAAPGSSEHQTGLCVDLYVTPGMRELENYGREGKYTDDIGFAETEEYQWLLENAHKFGFILRYPENKTAITGYAYESWHYRFVGIHAATEIYENGGTLEEYLAK